MPDNVTLDAGAGGETLATDLIAGVQHQRVKIQIGADGEAADVDGGEQTMANSIPVVVASDQTAIPISVASLPLPASAATNAAQLADGHNVTIDNAAGSAAVRGQGADAHDAAVAGDPVLQGGEARTSNPTAVGDGDAVRSMHDDVGRQVVRVNSPRDLVTDNNITLTNTSETTLIAAGGVGVFHDLTMLILSNTSSSSVRVDIRDATAGTILLSLLLAATGGGAVMAFVVPKNQATANNNWTAQLSGSVTDVRVYAQAVKNI